MVPKETKNLHWKGAWFHLLNGKKIKRPLWEDYWKWENNTIMMHCRDGSVTDIRMTENPAYTFTNIAQRDWMVVEGCVGTMTARKNSPAPDPEEQIEGQMTIFDFI